MAGGGREAGVRARGGWRNRVIGNGRQLDRMDDKTIEGLVAPTVEAMGYAVVRVRLSGSRAPQLQLMAERADGAAMTVDDCAAVSRAVSAALDAADPIDRAYRLEVSSPGVDRPLVRPADYERFAGFEAKLETAMPIGRRKRFRGRLAGCAEQAVRIDIGGADGVVEVPFAAIRTAKLAMTDALLAKAGAAGKEAQC